MLFNRTWTNDCQSSFNLEKSKSFVRWTARTGTHTHTHTHTHKHTHYPHRQTTTKTTTTTRSSTTTTVLLPRPWPYLAFSSSTSGTNVSREEESEFSCSVFWRVAACDDQIRLCSSMFVKSQYISWNSPQTNFWRCLAPAWSVRIFVRPSVSISEKLRCKPHWHLLARPGVLVGSPPVCPMSIHSMFWCIPR